jgi:hypothetical protein
MPILCLTELAAALGTIYSFHRARGTLSVFVRARFMRARTIPLVFRCVRINEMRQGRRCTVVYRVSENFSYNYVGTYCCHSGTDTSIISSQARTQEAETRLVSFS